MLAFRTFWRFIFGLVFLFSSLGLAASDEPAFSVAMLPKTLFVKVVDGLVYGAVCPEDTLEPKSLKDCFGKRAWPDSSTPYLSAEAFHNRVMERYRRSTGWKTNIEDLRRLIEKKNKAFAELTTTAKRLEDEIKTANRDIAFLEGRIREKSLPNETSEQLKKERALLIESRTRTETSLTGVRSGIELVQERANALFREISRNETVKSQESDFNSYLISEERHLFGGNSIRNISVQEPFGNLLVQLFVNPSVTMHWEGDEAEPHRAESAHVNYNHISLKKITLNSAFAPGGSLEVSLWQAGFWEASSFVPVNIPLTLDLIQGGGVIEGDKIPAPLREPKGRMWIDWSENEKRRYAENGIRIGNSMGLVTINLADPNWSQNIQLRSRVGEIKESTNQFLTAVLPPSLAEFKMGNARYLANQSAQPIYVLNTYNGRSGLLYCPNNVTLYASIPDSQDKPHHAVLAGEELVFSEFGAALQLKTSEKEQCNYTGWRQDQPLGNVIHIDGEAFGRH